MGSVGDMAEPEAAVTGVHLRRTDENVAEIEALAGLLGGRVGLDGLVDNLKYQVRPSRLGRLLGRAVDTAYAWNDYDSRDLRWWPQGISTSADASDAETYAGHRLVVTTWYSKDLGDGSYGSRVTFLDLETLRYRHVLLVAPAMGEDGQLTLRPLRIHAGGLVWRGPYLHVAATARGFVTCRVDDIMRVEGDDGAPDRFGVVDGRVLSYGHRHVLPVRFAYQAHADEGHERLRYSFMSLDRSTDPPGVLGGEYSRGGTPARLARFDLAPGTELLATGEDGYSRPATLADGGVVRMQGAVVAGGRHHLTVSHGPWCPGSAYVGHPGGFRRRRFAVPMGPEDLAYWPSTDRLWSLTEHPRRRWIVSMPRSWFD